MEAFTDWLASRVVVRIPRDGRQLRKTSVSTYSAMFSTWVQFLAERCLTVLEAGAWEMQLFFERHAPPLDEVSRRRYLQLFDKVYRHIKNLGMAKANPADALLASERVLESKFPPGLSLKDQELLLEQLSAGADWKHIRDRAAASLMWGAGLRCNEAVALRVQAISPEYRIMVKPSGVHRQHTTLVLPDGPWRLWLKAWLGTRSEMGIPGELVIPSKLDGKQYSPSGLYRRLDGLFNSAKLDSEKVGANVLRNTFVRHCLDSKRYTFAEIQEFLGHERPRALARHFTAQELREPAAAANNAYMADQHQLAF